MFLAPLGSWLVRTGSFTQTEIQSPQTNTYKKCESCGEVLSKRGMAVRLVANPHTELFSTDIPTDSLIEVTN